MARHALVYVFRGFVRRPAFGAGSRWKRGYAEVGHEVDGAWMTWKEATAEAEARGCRAVFRPEWFAQDQGYVTARRTNRRVEADGEED